MVWLTFISFCGKSVSYWQRRPYKIQKSSNKNNHKIFIISDKMGNLVRMHLEKWVWRRFTCDQNHISFEFLWTHFYEWKIASYKSETDLHTCTTEPVILQILLEIWNLRKVSLDYRIKFSERAMVFTLLWFFFLFQVCVTVYNSIW